MRRVIIEFRYEEEVGGREFDRGGLDGGDDGLGGEVGEGSRMWSRVSILGGGSLVGFREE